MLEEEQKVKTAERVCSSVKPRKSKVKTADTVARVRPYSRACKAVQSRV
jgi:hypothetical protein